MQCQLFGYGTLTGGILLRSAYSAAEYTLIPNMDTFSNLHKLRECAEKHMFERLTLRTPTPSKVYCGKGNLEGICKTTGNSISVAVSFIDPELT